MPQSNATTRFSDRAAAYAKHRPAYPAAAIDALLHGLGDPRALCAADVGAGTGISSRLLAERGVQVIAIEPNEAMRESAARDPRVVWRSGTAEATGLADGSVQIAAAFQAFHWFDPERAIAEFRRIATRRIGMLQYERDERDGFAAAYGRAIAPFMLDDTEQLRRRALDAFALHAGTGVRRCEVPFEQTLDLDGLLGHAASASYLPRSGEAANRLREELTQLFERWNDRAAVTLARICYVITLDR